MNEENKIYKGKDVKYGLKKALKLGYKDGLKEGKLLQRQEDVKEFKEMILELEAEPRMSDINYYSENFSKELLSKIGDNSKAGVENELL